MNTCLVTGVAGFIGSHLAQTLLMHGHRVIGIDNLSTGTQANVDWITANLSEENKSRFEFIKHDLAWVLTRQFGFDIDIIYHQAAIGSVPRSIADPVYSMTNNVMGFHNILEVARKYNVKRVVYASSSSVYGDDRSLFKQEDVTGQPLSPYAMSKQINELQAKTWGKVYGLKTIGLRYFNVFGERQSMSGDYAAVVPKWIDQIKHNKGVTIYGDGTQSRDFTYIDNVVMANLLAGSTENVAAYNDVFNIGCGESHSLHRLYTEVARNAVKNGYSATEIVYSNARAGDVKDSKASIERARRVLGYTPKVNFEEGIKRVCKYHLSESASSAEHLETTSLTTQPMT